ncbi:MAG: TolC family protein, partial [Gammaproteobacteria bacterium]|nr:TolC family protein [Gammaproteobacteria bacterium]
MDFLQLRPIVGRSVTLSVAISLVLLGSTVSVAANLKDNEHTISLREAIDKTIQFNPELRTFDFQLKAQDGRVQQSKLAPSPELNIALGDTLGTGDYKGLDNTQTTISIAWLFERGVRQYYIDSAQAKSSLLAVEANIKQLDAVAETTRRYINSLAYQSRMTNAKKTVQLAKETIVEVEKRVRAGKTPNAELFRAKAELARRELEREDIEHELESANRLLAAQWGEIKPFFSQVEGNIITLPQVASFTALKSQFKQNPELI